MGGAMDLAGCLEDVTWPDGRRVSTKMQIIDAPTCQYRFEHGLGQSELDGLLV